MSHTVTQLSSHWYVADDMSHTRDSAVQSLVLAGTFILRGTHSADWNVWWFRKYDSYATGGRGCCDDVALFQWFYHVYFASFRSFLMLVIF